MGELPRISARDQTLSEGETHKKNAPAGRWYPGNMYSEVPGWTGKVFPRVPEGLSSVCCSSEPPGDPGVTAGMNKSACLGRTQRGGRENRLHEKNLF